MLACSRRHKVWSAVDVIRAAGYPVEVHTSCITDDGYVMEIVRIMRTGTCLTPSDKGPFNGRLHSVIPAQVAGT